MQRETIPIRQIRTFTDGSELQFLPDSGCYVWLRPGDWNHPFNEVVIAAGSDQEALIEVGRIANEEYLNHMLSVGLHIRGEV